MCLVIMNKSITMVTSPAPAAINSAEETQMGRRHGTAGQVEHHHKVFPECL